MLHALSNRWQEASSYFLKALTCGCLQREIPIMPSENTGSGGSLRFSKYFLFVKEKRIFCRISVSGFQIGRNPGASLIA